MTSIQIAPDNSEWHRLLNACFEVPLGQTFLQDFPAWKQADSNTVRIGLMQAQKLVGACGARIASLKVAGKQVEVGLIGGVVTHPDLRGQGIAHELLKAAHSELDGRGIGRSILWGRESSLYTAFGYRGFGSQVRGPLRDFVGVQSQSFSPDFSVTVTRGTQLVQSAFEFARLRPRGVTLGEKDFQWWSAHKHVDVFTAQDRFGNPAGYAVIGRGIDLTNHLHDWAATSPEKLSALFHAVAKALPETHIMIGSAELRDICPSFGALPAGWVQESVALARGMEPSLEPDLWIWGLDAV